MSAPLRVGVIGLGARCVIAENCHKATIPAELVGGCDPNPAMRQRATEVLGDLGSWGCGLSGKANCNHY